MESLNLTDRARLVVALVEADIERLGDGADPNELLVRAVHLNAEGPEDTFRLLEAVRLELGLPPSPGPQVSAWWLLVGVLGLVVWVLAAVGAWHLVQGVI